ncbi:hypothetical protein Tco_0104697 [Tanacetum coccineum]
MSNYIKHTGSHTLQQLKRFSFDELKALFETTMIRVQTFHPIESEGDKTVPELTTGRSVKNNLKPRTLIATTGFSIDDDGRLENHTEAYQIFAKLLKKFDRDDLDKLWDLVKERFSTTEPTYDKDKELWVELKRLFEPDNDDTLWKLQRYMHDPLEWRLYDTCGVHHVSSGSIFRNGKMNGLWKIFILEQNQDNNGGGLLGIKASQVSTAGEVSTAGNGAVFIGRKTQRSLGAVLAVPDISGGRQAYKGAVQ